MSDEELQALLDSMKESFEWEAEQLKNTLKQMEESECK